MDGPLVMLDTTPGSERIVIRQNRAVEKALTEGNGNEFSASQWPAHAKVTGVVGRLLNALDDLLFVLMNQTL